MTTQHIETLIIGAGQAGLSTGYHLRELGRPFLIVDGNDRVGDNWRRQWDTLRLYTPAKYDGLPGLPFPQDGWSFPHKDEVADYLESYALHWDLPVRMSTRIDLLEARPGGGYTVAIGADTITCDNVVVATGTFGRTPYVPAFASELDPDIRQLHSSEYRRPSQLQPGKVLVVGASHSGTDIAYELASTHETVLCGRDCGQIPMRLESRKFRAAFPAMLFVARHVLNRRNPIGRKAMDEIRAHGGPMLRVKRADLEERHVERVLSRVTGVYGGLPVLGGDRVVDAANVVWCTGFKQVFDWIKLPVFGENGWPTEFRGVVDDAPGLYFCGLAFQYSFSSMVLPGIGRDAEYLARRIAARAPVPAGKRTL
ncbi:putative flavoprotein involved in K+ transport [Actinokineospora alba]|uniref:Putative flavoprotein involved in K+ transport n=1 Tax=Actinokineospora alba TaxID=504798 RepID=A0A1H0T4F8_9PSEU|nr:NAD(P)-binding domain-containing protein [Actinokineospora alba]TDP66389.1 putative flavoprotein involved in K+ transport [Actinokineospora alba]SDJ23764.1 putative flavoprotein involved in K+ transport [Actinokineospora alba]SDP48448.1 putative flavoprotein involved in K+ transport [Actinokineospora alba]